MDSVVRVTSLRPLARGRPLRRPLAVARVPAGFPSHAEDYIEQWLDLNEHLVHHPAATFFARVAGDSMTEAGIDDGDLLIVDRAMEPRDGQIVVAMVDGDFTVKRLRRLDDSLLLVPENPRYPVLEIDPFQQFEVWGVVTYVVRRV